MQAQASLSAHQSNTENRLRPLLLLLIDRLIGMPKVFLQGDSLLIVPTTQPDAAAGLFLFQWLGSMSKVTALNERCQEGVKQPACLLLDPIIHSIWFRAKASCFDD